MLFWFLGTSCSKLDPEEQIPSYIQVKSFGFTTPATGEQGPASSAIKDVWVFVDDKLQGVYQLPAKFPLLYAGSHKIRLRAGVLMNGIKSTRTDYPFYENFDTVVTLEPAKVTTLFPHIGGYKSATRFHWREEFEGIGVSLEKQAGSTNEMNVTSDPALVRNGINSGKFEIMPNTNSVEIVSTNAFVLPIQGTKCYFELDYNINQAFRMGLYAVKSGQEVRVPIIGLRPTRNDDGSMYWNKVYVELTDRVSENYDASGFRVYFESQFDSTVSNPVFYIDNLKLVSF